MTARVSTRAGRVTPLLTTATHTPSREINPPGPTTRATGAPPNLKTEIPHRGSTTVSGLRKAVGVPRSSAAEPRPLRSSTAQVPLLTVEERSPTEIELLGTTMGTVRASTSLARQLGCAAVPPRRHVPVATVVLPTKGTLRIMARPLSRTTRRPTASQARGLVGRMAVTTSTGVAAPLDPRAIAALIATRQGSAKGRE